MHINGGNRKELINMKKKFEEIREGARWRRYAIMAAINILFFALISVPMIWAKDGVMTDPDDENRNQHNETEEI